MSLRKDAEIMKCSHMTIKRINQSYEATKKIMSVCNLSSSDTKELFTNRDQALAIRLSKLPDNEIIEIINKAKSGIPIKTLVKSNTVTFSLIIKKDLYKKLKEKGYIKNLPELLEELATRI